MAMKPSRKPDAGGPELQERRRAIVAGEAAETAKFANEMLRWTLASLILVNGGALVALLNNEQTRAGLFARAGWFFVGGLFAALIAGFFFALYVSRFSGQLSDLVWRGEALEQEDIRQLTKKTSGKGARLGLGAFLLLVAAFACFVMGCLSVSAIPSQ
jgi:hypothetical protein